MVLLMGVLLEVVAPLLGMTPPLLGMICPLVSKESICPFGYWTDFE
jgi:hypothetical protein